MKRSDRRDPTALVEAEISTAIASTSTQRLRPAQIRTDGGTQPRAGIDEQAVKEYAEAITGPNDWPFPPVDVFHDGEHYWLADGFHRLAAARRYAEQNKLAYTVLVDVHQGTVRDAILHSVGANAAHGLRRTNEDKRRVVLRLLKDSEWSEWSNREIARRCRVDEKTVRNLRDSLSAENPQMQPTERKVERGGTVYTQNTANIGTSRPTLPPRTLTQIETEAVVARFLDRHHSGDADERKLEITIGLDYDRLYHMLTPAVTLEVGALQAAKMVIAERIRQRIAARPPAQPARVVYTREPDETPIRTGTYTREPDEPRTRHDLARPQQRRNVHEAVHEALVALTPRIADAESLGLPSYAIAIRILQSLLDATEKETDP